MTYSETDLIASIEHLAGGDLATLPQEHRDQFDQFHAGGSEAVARLLPGLRLTPGMIVLDIGSGFGGPARQVARTTGCTVVGVDITPAYVEAAQELSHAAGLAEQVRFFCSDIAAFHPEADFDAAYTMHVQMNVADKKTYFSEIARRLRPGARLATFEVCRTGSAQPTPPLPWSLDGTDSFLATADELHDTIRSSGFDPVEWVDETTWVNQWFEALGHRLANTDASADASTDAVTNTNTSAVTTVTLPTLLTDGPTRMLNFASELATGTLSIHRGLFTLAP